MNISDMRVSESACCLTFPPLHNLPLVIAWAADKGVSVGIPLGRTLTNSFAEYLIEAAFFFTQ